MYSRKNAQKQIVAYVNQYISTTKEVDPSLNQIFPIFVYVQTRLHDVPRGFKVSLIY